MDQDQSENTQAMRTEAESNRGVEWFLGVIVALLLAVVAVPGIKPVEELTLEQSTVRGFEELLVLARDEAVRTGADHIVFFEAGEGAGSAVEGMTSRAMVWLIRDRNGDARGTADEVIASVPVNQKANIDWGTRFATRPAIGDVASELAGPLSFAVPQAEGQVPALVFRQDGTPVATGSGGDARGSSGSGAGTVYLRSSTRDYAVVLSPWGDIDVQVWDDAKSAWQIASAH